MSDSEYMEEPLLMEDQDEDMHLNFALNWLCEVISETMKKKDTEETPYVQNALQNDVTPLFSLL